jgi:hypothetical protein
MRHALFSGFARRLSLVIATAAVLSCALSTVQAGEGARPLRVYGNITTIELAPVLLAADRYCLGANRRCC